MAEASPAKRMGRPPAGQGPDPSLLLRGALAAFAENGYDGTSVRELSRRMGVSHALLTARFGSKEGLWFAAMEHVLAQAKGSWRELAEDPGLDDLDVLRQGIIHQVTFSAAHPELVRIMTHEGAIDSPRMRFIFEYVLSPLRLPLERRLNRLIAAGRIRPVPYATLHYLVVQGSGALYASPVESTLLGAPQPPEAEDVRRHAETVADIIVAGLSRGGPG
ncbi:TetR/AcrR family transcriptional regulator [Streptomyces sp. NPDC060223]|uniref:TetR/AcrR family transcriptional regulator n=1 Tax=unclassified Streptomyces TaxID=2593676 RepID=UPI00363C5DBB